LAENDWTMHLDSPPECWRVVHAARLWHRRTALLFTPRALLPLAAAAHRDRNRIDVAAHLLRFLAAFAGAFGELVSMASRPRSTANRKTTERDKRPTTKMSLLLRSVGMSASARCKSDLGRRRVTMLESAIGSFLRDFVRAKLSHVLGRQEAMGFGQRAVKSD
jgi:hypothetical protein